MEIAQWQHRFERWLDENHTTDDAAHDISHFRRVWMTAQKIMDNHLCFDKNNGKSKVLLDKYSKK